MRFARKSCLAFPDLTATNLTAPNTNEFQSMALPVPHSFYVSPEATMGTGQLASPIIGTSSLTGPAPVAPESPRSRGTMAIREILRFTLF